MTSLATRPFGQTILASALRNISSTYVATHRALRPAVVPGPIYGEAYVKAIAAAKINLGLLSTIAGDAITQRSIELPDGRWSNC